MRYEDSRVILTLRELVVCEGGLLADVEDEEVVKIWHRLLQLCPLVIQPLAQTPSFLCHHACVCSCVFVFCFVFMCFLVF